MGRVCGTDAMQCNAMCCGWTMRWMDDWGTCRRVVMGIGMVTKDSKDGSEYGKVRDKKA